MGRILFADLLQPKLDIPKADGCGTYWQELSALVARRAACPHDWVLRLRTDTARRERQLDKFEPVITYYLLTALSLATASFAEAKTLGSLFARAFSNGETIDRLVALLSRSGWERLRFEALLCPTPQHREAVKMALSDLPVSYVREIGSSRPGVRFESATHLDAFAGDPSCLVDGGGCDALGLEAKFTSDIDHHTTYATHRNQVIRNVEVGNARFSSFMFLLVTPRAYWQRRSRFYVYKMNEYLAGRDGVEALRRDAIVAPSADEAAAWQGRMGWLAWEDVVDVAFPGGRPAFSHPDAMQLVAFLRDRRLIA